MKKPRTGKVFELRRGNYDYWIGDSLGWSLYKSICPRLKKGETIKVRIVEVLK